MKGRKTAPEAPPTTEGPVLPVFGPDNLADYLVEELKAIAEGKAPPDEIVEVALCRECGEVHRVGPHTAAGDE